jgi:hypothetical protein
LQKTSSGKIRRIATKDAVSNGVLKREVVASHCADGSTSAAQTDGLVIGSVATVSHEATRTRIIKIVLSGACDH